MKRTNFLISHGIIQYCFQIHTEVSIKNQNKKRTCLIKKNIYIHIKYICIPWQNFQKKKKKRLNIPLGYLQIKNNSYCKKLYLKDLFKKIIPKGYIIFLKFIFTIYFIHSKPYLNNVEYEWKLKIKFL